jgi:hypothetical protein
MFRPHPGESLSYFLKFLFQVPAIYPAWRRKEVEFERFIAVEDKDRARAHTRIAE